MSKIKWIISAMLSKKEIQDVVDGYIELSRNPATQQLFTAIIYDSATDFKEFWRLIMVHLNKVGYNNVGEMLSFARPPIESQAQLEWHLKYAVIQGACYELSKENAG